jgi:hypothetical protein
LAWPIVFAAVVAIAGLQFGYFAGAGMRHLVFGARVRRMRAASAAGPVPTRRPTH